MAEDKKLQNNKNHSPDWFVRGVLTRLGEMLDRFTGRNWKPSSSLATSELIEKLKVLLDAEAQNLGEKGIFVPHHIKLKMQWDKFSTDAEQSLKKLEYELLTAAIDHINDCRYHTYAPLQLEVKPDYFTDGVRLSASFDDFADEKEDETAVSVSVPDLKNVVIAPPEKIVEPEVKAEKEIFTATFVAGGQPKEVKLAFSEKERKSVGRTKENDLWLDDASVSKMHAALVLGTGGQLMIADTGSTNGTFVGGEHIAYGKAIVLKDADKLRFGTVEVELRRVGKRVGADEFINRNSPENEMATNKDFSTEETVRPKSDYSGGKSFPLDKKAGSEQILPETNFQTTEDFATKADFSENGISLSTENQTTRDLKDKTAND